jgi:SPOR domain
MSGPPPNDAPPPEAAPPPPPHDPYRCPRCNSPYDPFQEYCLECGQRLVPYPGMSLWRRDSWSRQSPLWFWGALIALFAIALVTGAIVLAARDDDNKGNAQGPTTSVLSSPSFSVSTGTLPATVPPPTTLNTDTLATTLPTTSSTTPTFSTSFSTTAPTTTPTTSTGLTTWPSGKSGYTVILESLTSKSAADSKAQQAKGDGLPEVGVLNSSNYSSLNPGFWVVFSGVYDTLSEANSAVPTAKSAGWPAAYVRQITP